MKAGSRNYLVQHSPLLYLPAELRIHIYGYVASSVDSISVREDRILYAPPLSLVCRQIRHEYEETYVDTAPRYTHKIYINITDFVHRSKSKGDAASSIEQLPPGTDRTYTFRIWLTNMFEAHNQDLRSFCRGKPLNHEPRVSNELTRNYDVDIRWDPRSFDVDALRRAVPRQRWYHCSPARAPYSREWLQVEAAIEKAYVRYAPAVKVGRRKRGKAAKKGSKLTGKRRKTSAVRDG